MGKVILNWHHYKAMQATIQTMFGNEKIFRIYSFCPFLPWNTSGVLWKKNQSTPLTPYVAYLLFLFRTVAMMLSMISLISVSLLMTWLFKEILTKSSNLTNLSVFLRDPLYKDGNARFTTVPLKLCLIMCEFDFNVYIF